MSKRTKPPFLEPYFLFLVFVGIGLGTIMLDESVRLAMLWTTLAILSVAYRAEHEVDATFSLAGVGRGALLGLVISLPLLAFLSEQFRTFTERLYGTRDVVMIFYQVCFVSPLVEEYFFRGIVQGSKGSSVSIALYALTALLFFLPHTNLLASVIIFTAMGLLGIVYAYVADRYGLAASMASHVVVGFILQVTPSLIAGLREMLA